MAEVFLGLLTNIAWLAIGLSGQLLYLAFRDRHLRRIFSSLWGAGTTVIVVSNISTPGTAREYTRPSTGMGEVQALSTLVSILTHPHARRPTIEVLPSQRPLPTSKLRTNVLCIGGTQYNEATRLFSSMIAAPAFDVDNTPPKSIVENATGTRYRPEISPPGDVLVDYGILTSMPNPLAPGSRVVILRGSHTYGVAGIAEYLARRDLKGASELRGVYKSPAWQAVIRTRVLPDGEVIASLVEARQIAEEPRVH